jgi:hypothetical protein
MMNAVGGTLTSSQKYILLFEEVLKNKMFFSSLLYLYVLGKENFEFEKVLWQKTFIRFPSFIMEFSLFSSQTPDGACVMVSLLYLL